MLLDVAFTVLLLLISGVSAESVPPPTNVAVSCQNVKITVGWDYSTPQPHPPTTFSVNISGSSGNSEVSETTDHQFDLSHFVWKSEENYRDFLYVTVAAIQGGSRSEGVKSNTFSFSDVKTVKTKCSLDFPPVEVEVDVIESRAMVTFPNPVDFYKELKQTVNLYAAPKFKYIVSSVTNSTEKTWERECTVNQEYCTLDVLFPDKAKKCVTLKGMLFDSNNNNQVVFNKTTEICAQASVEVHVVIVAVILFLVLGLVITVVIICNCKTDAQTLKPVIRDFEENSNQTGQKHLIVHTEVISEVSICIKSSVSSEDSLHSEDICTNYNQHQAREHYMARRLSESSNQELEHAVLLSEGSGTDSDSAQDSVKTESVSLCSEEDKQDSMSHYDRRHAVLLEISDGDMVTGYKE